jgi:hypothetical protein
MKTPKTTFNQATLINLLTTAFAFNLARIKCLALIILALIEARSVNLTRIAGFCNSKTALSSRYRRLQRFIQQVKFPPAKLALLLLHMMGIKPTDRLILILDRTNWKFGKKDCNILYLAAAYQGIAIPLFILFSRIRKRVILTMRIVSTY